MEMSGLKGLALKVVVGATLVGGILGLSGQAKGGVAYSTISDMNGNKVSQVSPGFSYRLDVIGSSHEGLTEDKKIRDVEWDVRFSEGTNVLDAYAPIDAQIDFFSGVPMYHNDVDATLDGNRESTYNWRLTDSESVTNVVDKNLGHYVVRIDPDRVGQSLDIELNDLQFVDDDVRDYEGVDGVLLESYGYDPQEFGVAMYNLSVPVVAATPGDTNGDGLVDVADLAVLSRNYDSVVSGGAPEGDFNGDTLVDVGDLGIMGANWTSGGAGGSGVVGDIGIDPEVYLDSDSGRVTSVPAPVGGLAGLVSLGGLGLVGRSRRFWGQKGVTFGEAANRLR